MNPPSPSLPAGPPAIAVRAIEENVSVPLVIQGEQRRVAEARAREVLACVGIPEKADQPPGKLSGGQQGVHFTVARRMSVSIWLRSSGIVRE